MNFFQKNLQLYLFLKIGTVSCSFVKIYQHPELCTRDICLCICLILPTAQLHSKEDDMREIAAEACGHLARQISDPEALKKLVKHCFAVLNGRFFHSASHLSQSVV